MATQTSPRRLLGDIAWAHSGDKGDCVNLGVVARDPRDYAFLLQHVTAQRVREGCFTVLKNAVPSSPVVVKAPDLCTKYLYKLLIL